MPSSPTSNVETDPLIGTTIGGTYKVIRKIGTGGMGSVYEAHHARLPRKFAIKVMLPEIASDKVSFERFRREAETTSSLGNVHIAEVMDFNALDDGSPYMVMELLEGEDLGTRLDRDGPLSPRRTALIVAQMADALASAHAHGVIHRDIKPGNIFLVRRERDEELIKLLDFGAAKSNRKQSNLTMAGVVVGTPWYMSPEQAQGKELDARSDQFSLAVLTYEMLTMRLPFEHEDSMQVLFKIVEQPPVPIRERDARLPEKLDAVLARALAKNPSERFKSVVEFSERLGVALGAPAPKRPRHNEPEVTNPGATVVVAIKPDSPVTDPSAAQIPHLRNNDHLHLERTDNLERPAHLDLSGGLADPDDEMDRTRKISQQPRVRRKTPDAKKSPATLMQAVAIAAVGGALVGAAIGAWLYFGRGASAPVAAPSPPPPTVEPPPPPEPRTDAAPPANLETAPEVRLHPTPGHPAASPHAVDPRATKPAAQNPGHR